MYEKLQFRWIYERKAPNRCDFDRRFEVHETGKLVFRRRAGCQPHYYEYDNLLNKSSISQSNTGAFSRFKKNEQELIVFRTDFIFEGVFYFHWLFLRTRIHGHGHVCCRSLITQSLTVVFSTILRCSFWQPRLHTDTLYVYTHCVKINGYVTIFHFIGCHF